MPTIRPTGQLVDHSITEINDGRKTVTTAGTRVPLVSSSTPCRIVDITAMASNTGIIVVGSETCVAANGTRRGMHLAANDVYTINIDNLEDIYIDSTVNGEGVTFVYYN